VLRPERLEHEPFVARRRGWIEACWDELGLGHAARLDDTLDRMGGPMDAAALWNTFVRHQQLVYAHGRARFVRDGPGWWAVVTGESHPDLNLCGLTSEATALDARDMTETVARLGVSCAASVSGVLGADIAAVLLAAGFERAPKSEPLMWCERPPEPHPTAFRIAPAESPGDVAIAAAVAAEGHAAPKLPDVIERHPRRNGPVSAWLAWDGDEAISVVWLTIDRRIGVWAMMTPARHRRRGAGRAVLTAALAASWREDTAGAYLWSSPLGRPLYESIGFDAVDECWIWVLGGTEELLAAIGNV
jgi:hypothetical protein